MNRTAEFWSGSTAPKFITLGYQKSGKPTPRSRNPRSADVELYRISPEDVKVSHEFVFVNLENQRYRSLRPLQLEVKQKGSLTTVLSHEYDLYGVGDTLAEAVRDFFDMLIETYEELSQAEPRLSRYLSKQLEELRSLIVER